MKNLNQNAIGVSAAVLAGLLMLVIGVLAMFGVYMEAFEAMKVWHIWFDATIIGVIAGVLEAAVISYIGGYLFGWIYNVTAK